MDFCCSTISIRCALVLCVLISTAQAATIVECQKLLQSGQYAEALTAASEAIEKRSYGEEWPILKADAEIHLGKYDQAKTTIQAGLERYSWSIRLRMQLHGICHILGDPQLAEKLIDEINSIATAAPWRYTDADDLVALGRAAIVMGADPRDVLEGFFDRARRNYSSRPDGYVAAGELALNKGDFALAAEILRPAAEKFPEDAQVLFLLSEALKTADGPEAAKLLQRTLASNPRHLTALQRLAEKQIDAEDYAAAGKILDDILTTNPRHPETHALQAVIHHLHNRTEEASASRSQALHFSPQNPEVDFVIGKHLSRKYRFQEGATHQRQALKIDPQYLPAKAQLAQDLLRLGRDDEGWKLADESQQQDRYSTTLYNLMQLQDTVNKFATIRNDHFVIRMEKSEAAVYGAQVEALLNEAFAVLSEKYGYVPDEPVVVEIFHRADDFAVRTFGVPDVAGFLGVCFGKLITANSPASQRNSPNNWRSVLWHEFCHVITLQMTGNKIPRWLSEGISVYEERLQDTRWGQSMTPEARARIQEGKVTPLSKLSSAFLNAESGADLNFAYFESSLAVEFIVQTFGFAALVEILNSLNDGLTINDALQRHTVDLEELDQQFQEYLNQQAADYAQGVQFLIRQPDQPIEPADLDAAKQDPANYSAGLLVAADLLRENQLEAAAEKLQQLIQLHPEDNSPSGARPMLAMVYKRQTNTPRQIEVLSQHLQRSGDDLTAAMELQTLQTAAENWEQALAAGQMVLAIDPLQPAAVRQTLKAALAVDETQLAIQMLNALLELEPADAARSHFQLASLLKSPDPPAAKRHALLALEQAPRYRDAHKLLLQLIPDTEPAAGAGEKPAEQKPAESKR